MLLLREGSLLGVLGCMLLLRWVAGAYWGRVLLHGVGWRGIGWSVVAWVGGRDAGDLLLYRGCRDKEKTRDNNVFLTHKI